MKKLLKDCLKIICENNDILWNFLNSSKTEGFGSGLGMIEVSSIRDHFQNIKDNKKKKLSNEEICQNMREYIFDLCEKSPTILNNKKNNIDYLFENLELNKNEQKLLNFVIELQSNNYNFTSQIWILLNYIGTIDVSLGKLLDIPNKEIKKMIYPSSFFISTGIFVCEQNSPYSISISDYYYKWFSSCDNIEQFENNFFPYTTESQFEIKDFLDNDLIKIGESVEKTFEKDNKKLNILLWGIPGVGKSQIVASFAKHYNWKIINIGSIQLSDLHEHSKMSNQRLTRLNSLIFALKFYEKTKQKVVLLFDEFDDLFSLDFNAPNSILNRYLEEAKIPIFFTSNDIYKIHNSIKRRFDITYMFDEPKYAEKVKYFEYYIKKYNFELDTNIIKEISKEYFLTPALIENIVKFASLSNANSLIEIEKIVCNTLNAYYSTNSYKPKIKIKSQANYNLKFINCDFDLENFINQISKTDEKYSICINGPPGTGKTQFIHYLANILNKKVIEKQASDLLDMYVGGTEANIANAFFEAEQEDAILLLNEVDSFLSSRENAIRSYEVSQTNEMLTQIEKKKIIFAATTNFNDKLDFAVSRRFDFEFLFKNPTAEMSKEIFKEYFDELPDNYNYNLILTPGNAQVIKNQAKLLNINEPKDIMNLINKKIKQPNSIGFI